MISFSFSISAMKASRFFYFFLDLSLDDFRAVPEPGPRMRVGCSFLRRLPRARTARPPCGLFSFLRMAARPEGTVKNQLTPAVRLALWNVERAGLQLCRDGSARLSLLGPTAQEARGLPRQSLLCADSRPVLPEPIRGASPVRGRRRHSL